MVRAGSEEFCEIEEFDAKANPPSLGGGMRSVQDDLIADMQPASADEKMACDLPRVGMAGKFPRVTTTEPMSIEP